MLCETAQATPTAFDSYCSISGIEPVRGGGGELSLGEGRRRDTWAHLIASGPDAARQMKADEAGEDMKKFHTCWVGCGRGQAASSVKTEQ